MGLTIIQRTPTTEEYNELRRLAEWPTLDEELVKEGLAHSLYSVVVQDETGIIIGMGRVLGYNAIYLHIQMLLFDHNFKNKGDQNFKNKGLGN